MPEIEGASGIKNMLDRLDPPAEVREVVDAIEKESGRPFADCPARGLAVVRELRAYTDGQVLMDALCAHMFGQAAKDIEAEQSSGDEKEPTTIDRALEQGYKIDSKAGGWHTVTGPAMPEPKKVQGDDDLDKLLEELMARELED